MRPLRSVTVAAATAALALGLVTAPASADDRDGGGRLLGSLAAGAGMVGADAGGVVAPPSDDARPVEPEVELVTIDDAPLLTLSDETTDPADAAAGQQSETETAQEPAEGAEEDHTHGAEEDHTHGAEEDHTHGAEEDHTHGAEEDHTHDVDDQSSLDEAVADTLAEHGAVLVEDGSGGASATVSVATPDLAIVGVSWATGTGAADLEIAWRSESASQWSEWEAVHIELADAPDSEDAAGTRDGTPPLAVVDAATVEVRLMAASGRLPDDVQVGVVDPGTSTADAAVPVGSGSGAGSVSGGTAGGAGTGVMSPGVADVTMQASGTARPTINSRAQWGADERMMTWTPSQGRVQGIDIHHTVNANNYTQAQVPGLMRGIYAYHAQSWGRGWGDIGYNFVVDRFGRIWEGRAGGVDSAPVGAHATGLNSNMSGISLLGNFDITPVPAAAFTAVAKLAAWKLWLHGVASPHGTIRLDAGTFNRIAGHRDAKQTTCPGRYMYDRLPEMRNRIATYIGSFGNRYLDRDLDGDGKADLVAVDRGVVSLISTVSTRSWARAELGAGWRPAMTAVLGDMNGDGRPDLVHVSTAGTLHLYPTDRFGRTSLATRTSLGGGWGKFTRILGGHDLTGDGRPDLLAVRSDGHLLLYRGTATGVTFHRDLGPGWNAMTRLSLLPQFRNGQLVLLGQHTNGVVYGYPVPGNGTLSPRFEITRGWTGMRLATGVADQTGDGRGDLVAVDSAGRMWRYPGTGAGRLAVGSRVLLDTGRQPVAQLLAAAQTDNRTSLYSVVGSVINMNRVTLRAAYSDPISTGLTIEPTARVVVAGDWNWDGRPDLFVIPANGALMLHAGLGNGKFSSTATRIGTGNWNRFAQVIGSGNWRGDGRPGLIAYDAASGRLWYYPSDGRSHFDDRVLISNGAEGMDLLAYAGRINGATVPDLLMRGAGTHRMFFYDGNGPGLTLPPVRITIPWSTTRSVVGVNDVSGDGVSDIVTILSNGSLRLYQGSRDGTLRPPTVVGSLRSGTTIS